MNNMQISENPASISWLYVEAGNMLYGAKNEKTHITNSFYISKTPVTNWQYALFLRANPNHRVPYNHRQFLNDDWAIYDNWNQLERTPPTGKMNHPVVLVNWDDANAFCNWALCQLPSQLQWERAARGQSGNIQPWGGIKNKGTNCNCSNNSNGTTPVDTFSPSGDSVIGAVDMCGNVWEWCTDWYDSNHKSKVLRGGSWDYDCDLISTTLQYGMYPHIKRTNVGFRCVRLAAN